MEKNTSKLGLTMTYSCGKKKYIFLLQEYVLPFWKPIMSLHYEPDGQEQGSMFWICHALLKNAILLFSSLVAGTVPEDECEAFAIL